MSERLRAQVETMKVAGSRLANLAYNLSQPSWPFEERHRDEMRELSKAWDAALTGAAPGRG